MISGATKIIQMRIKRQCLLHYKVEIESMYFFNLMKKNEKKKTGESSKCCAIPTRVG